MYTGTFTQMSHQNELLSLIGRAGAMSLKVRGGGVRAEVDFAKPRAHWLIHS